jgi:hypothetical protein
MPEGTPSRVTVADRPYGEFYDLYSISLEYFGYNLVIRRGRLEIECLIRSIRFF